MTQAECITKFHAHLDECQQCRENPFRLCKVGAPLLLAIQYSKKPDTAVDQP